MDDKEYQAEYEKAMAELEASENGTAAAVTPEATTEASQTPDPATEAQPAPAEPVKAPEGETIEQLRERLAQQEKALKDTQRWAHENAAALKRLQQEREAAEHAAKKPQLLNDIEGLEEAVKYVAEAPKPQEVNPEQAWLEAISKAHPDVNDLLAEDAFFKSVEARRQSSGADWNDPLVAIREITAAKLERAEAVKAQAIEQARKDFEAKQNQKAAMQVPGGHTGAAPRESDPQADMVKKYQTMSDEEFAKEVAKVTGF
jgi:hypothetical protein